MPNNLQVGLYATLLIPHSQSTSQNDGHGVVVSRIAVQPNSLHLTKVMILPLLLLSLTLVSCETYRMTIQPYGANGTCSPKLVDWFSYSATVTRPITGIFGCNRQAYEGLWKANFSQPASANLAPPLLDMSCALSNSTECKRQMDSKKATVPQTLCILFKNWSPGVVQANLTVTWRFAQSVTKVEPPPAAPPVSTSSASHPTLSAGWLIVLWIQR
jgi:hypothetical protein